MSKQYTNLKCPSCGKKGNYETDPNLEIYCTKCGLIIQSKYPYTAGIRFDTLTYILLKKESEKQEKRRQKWLRRYLNDRNKKLQKI